MSQSTALAVFRTRARTFWFAAYFLPPHARGAVNGLYSFARAVDDLVDEPSSLKTEQIRSILSAWHVWLGAPRSPDAAPNARIASEVLPVLVDHGVPARYLQVLVEGVASDLNPRELAGWPELREYCVQVASSVGLAMCHLLGAGDDPLARQAAVELGIAMQLTNILRDLWDDVNAGRVYLPADELAEHGFSRDHLVWLGERVIADGRSAIDDRFRRLMRGQIERARAHYERGLEGIWRLPGDARFAILVASRLYGAILAVIEAADYDVFSRRAATSAWVKASSAAGWWLAHRVRPSQTARLAPNVVRA
jgi:phytoene synthase